MKIVFRRPPPPRSEISRDATVLGYFPFACIDNNTVVILINATTLMHKSTFNTNNFGNNHFGQEYQEQNILRIFKFSGHYNGVCLKNFQGIEQKRENAFLAKLSILLRIS